MNMALNAVVVAWDENRGHEGERDFFDARDLADRLGLSFVMRSQLTANHSHFLTVSNGCIEIQENKSKSKGFAVDFLTGELDYRRRYSKGQQLIVKAIGGGEKRVLDAMTGFGADAFVMAAHNCRVTALEKSPLVFELVNDGLKRATEQVEDLGWLSSRLEIIQSDAREFLRKCDSQFDAIYLDPMFPEKQKTALPKKEMQILKKLVGETPEEEVLEAFALARELTKRIVVKRPLRAPPIYKPVTTVFEGQSTRFDVYCF